MSDKIKVIWEGPDEDGTLTARVPAKDYRGQGHFVFYAAKRPHYCDRGSFLVYCEAEGVADLDHQEGFPRYYFSEAAMKAEIEAWVNKRDVCRAA